MKNYKSLFKIFLKMPSLLYFSFFIFHFSFLAAGEMPLELEELHRHYHERSAAITEEATMAADILREKFMEAVETLDTESEAYAQTLALYDTHSLKAEHDTLVAIGRLSRDYERSLASLLTLFQQQKKPDDAEQVKKEQAWVAEALEKAGARAREIRALQEPPKPVTAQPEIQVEEEEEGRGGEDATPFRIRKAIDSALLQLNRKSLGTAARGAGIGYYIELEFDRETRDFPDGVQVIARVPHRAPIFVAHREKLKEVVTHVIPADTTELVLDIGPPYDPLTVPIDTKTRERINLGRLVLKKTEYEGTMAISGTVLDAVTRTPIAGAIVTTDEQKYVTGEDGNYRLEGFTPSLFAIHIAAPGYIPRTVDRVIRQILFHEVQQDFALTKTGSVTLRYSMALKGKKTFDDPKEWTVTIPLKAQYNPTAAVSWKTRAAQDLADKWALNIRCTNDGWEFFSRVWSLEHENSGDGGCTFELQEGPFSRLASFEPTAGPAKRALPITKGMVLVVRPYWGPTQHGNFATAGLMRSSDTAIKITVDDIQ